MRPMTEESVGQRIRRLRLARGLSQRAVSGPGVSYAYVSRIEAGDRTPSLRALRHLAGKLGVNPEYLEDGRAIPAAKERELRLADAEIGLRMGGDLGRAEETLRTLLREEIPDGLEIRIRATLGKLFAEKGDNDGALLELEHVVASGGVRPETRPDVYETLATVYAATKRAPQAIDLLARCIAAVDEDEEALTQGVRYRSVLAQVFSSVGALDRARDVLEEATHLAESLARPQDRVALYWTGARIEWMQAQDADAALAFTGRAIGPWPSVKPASASAPTPSSSTRRSSANASAPSGCRAGRSRGAAAPSPLLAHPRGRGSEDRTRGRHRRGSRSRRSHQRSGRRASRG